MMGLFTSSQKVVIQETAACILDFIENSITKHLVSQTDAALNSKVPKKQRFFFFVCF
jgi:hypothetical protein